MGLLAGLSKGFVKKLLKASLGFLALFCPVFAKNSASCCKKASDTAKIRVFFRYLTGNIEEVAAQRDSCQGDFTIS